MDADTERIRKKIVMSAAGFEDIQIRGGFE